jgi:hypothetical protein
MRFVLWFAQYLAVQQHGGIGGNHQAASSFWQFQRFSRFEFGKPLGHLFGWTSKTFLRRVFVNR